jgi:hypothetical protein
MPKVHFLAPHPLFGRVNNRIADSHQKRSPYFWWWAHLRRSEAYQQRAEALQQNATYLDRTAFAQRLQNDHASKGRLLPNLKIVD